MPDGSTPNQLVLSPSPALLKNHRRPAERGNSARDIGSVQPLAPTSRRASQQRDVTGLSTGGLNTPHPYAAAPSPNGYRNVSAQDAYGRQSPNPSPHLLPNGTAANGAHPTGSESFLYGQGPTGKNGTNSREGTATGGTTQREFAAGVRGMNIYDREQMQRVGEQDEDGGHGRRRGFWGTLCCRA